MTDSDMTRRGFLGATAAGAVLATTPADAGDAKTEYRNRRDGMAYRRLGRTGMMISEVVCGGDPVRPDNYKHVALAVERGLNYLDMAPQYGRGGCEKAYGKLLKESVKRRDVFLTTKLSFFNKRRNDMYMDVFKGLPGEKQAAIRKRADELRRLRGVDKPGYFLEYYPGEGRMFTPTYIRVAMRRDYAHKVDGSKELRDFIRKSIEGSLKRVGTDHFDLFLGPHGADAPEDVQVPEIIEEFAKIKKAGKARFLGVSSHNDPAGVLDAAVASGHYDMAMVAYNVINGGYLDGPVRRAAAAGVGVVAMKAAHAVATHHKKLQPIPEWRVKKVNRIVPGDVKTPLKAYIWALQNPRIAAVISNLWDEQYVKENLAVAGMKVELRPA